MNKQGIERNYARKGLCPTCNKIITENNWTGTDGLYNCEGCNNTVGEEKIIKED